MPLSIAYLLDRVMHAKSRADELEELRARWRRIAGAAGVSPEETRLALELRALRREMIDALGEVEACKTCARGHPFPHGRWPGGHCCGGTTRTLFTDDELASLRAAGTRARDFCAPRCDHAGCSFRSVRGCSLRPEDRPNLCVRYSCPDLRVELRARGDLRRIDRLGDALLHVFGRFVRAREERRNDEVFADLLSSKEFE